MSPEVMIGEAARILSISANHVRYLERTGQLRARRIGKYRVFIRKDVEALAEERYRKATGQSEWRLLDPV
jgi:DNA-binding transcriptional MerR regulator